MSLIKKEELKLEASKYSRSFSFTTENKLQIQPTDFEQAFRAGAEFAESKLKDFFKEFAGYYYCNCDNNCEGEKEYWFNKFVEIKNIQNKIRQ